MSVGNTRGRRKVETDCINQELLAPVNEVDKEITSSDASIMMELKSNSRGDNNSSSKEQVDNVEKETNDDGTKRIFTCKLCGREFGKKKQLKQHLTKHEHKLIEIYNKDDSIKHVSDQETVNIQDTVILGLVSPEKILQSIVTKDSNPGENLPHSYEEVEEKGNPGTVFDKEDMIPPEEPKVTVVKSPSIRNILKKKMIPCRECSRVLSY